MQALSDLPSGTTVLVRGDVDAKPGAKVGEGDIRLRSMADTLRFGRERAGNKSYWDISAASREESLAKVARRLGELMQCEVPLVTDWLDESTLTIRDDAVEPHSRSVPGQHIVAGKHALLRNRARALEGQARRFAQVWPSRSRGLRINSPKRSRADYVNEALSAGSLDSSSTIVPAAMERVALGGVRRQRNSTDRCGAAWPRSWWFSAG